MSAGGSRSAADRDRLRIGVLGAGGQLGRCLVRATLGAPDLALGFAVSRAEFDLAETAGIDAWLDRAADERVDVVINAAAFTKVDACESQVELARQMNATVPGAWARATRARGLRFIHLSTDYVFPGDGQRPYREDDPTGPRSVYGETKREGEVRVLEADPTALVVRTSWVFGPGRNFVLAILDQAAKRRRGEAAGPLRVVDDQFGSPTAAADLADGLLALCRLGAKKPGAEPDRQGAAHAGAPQVGETQVGETQNGETQKGGTKAGGSPPGTPSTCRGGTSEGTGAALAASGLLHLCNAGVTTWFGFARAILDQAGYRDIGIDPVATGVFATAAPRPAYSVLDCSRARGLGVALRPWTEALAGYLAGPDRPTHLIVQPIEP